MTISTSTQGEQGRSLSSGVIKTLALASLGGALEFYDFVIFVFLTVPVGKVFFPADLPDWIRQLQVLGIFAAGYLARPLGGTVMSHFGDISGRKRMFTLSVLLMAIPTLLIGVLPTYKTIGAAAPIALLLMRVMQGMAIGGEAPGGWVFVAEHAPRERTGLAIGLLTSGLTGGILLGSLVATAMNLLFTQAQITAGVWRVPFIIGGGLGFLAMVLRRWLEETPVFQEMRARAAISRELPLRRVLKSYKAAIAASMASTWTLTAAIVVIILVMPSLLQKTFGLAPQVVQSANLAATAALSVTTVLTGIAADRFGIRIVSLVSFLFLIAASYGLFYGAALHPSAILLFYVIAGAATGAVTITPILMVRLFPPEVRFSGISFSYNVAYAVLGGVTPVLVSYLVHQNRFYPAHYMALAAVAGLVASLTTSRLAVRTQSSGL